MAIGTNRGFRINKCTNRQESALDVKINKEIQGGVSLVQVLDETNILVYVVDREEGG